MDYSRSTYHISTTAIAIERFEFIEISVRYGHKNWNVFWQFVCS